jgi:hypothetical protein
MKALVVYESLYGNTAAIGEAIAEALRAQGLEADARPVTKVPPAETAGFDPLVVGGPTHAHGMSRPSTRKSGAGDQKNTFAEPTVEPGLRDWLGSVPGGAGRYAAAFDTRFDRSALLTGSAARGMARRLEHHGFRLVVGPESFFVTGQNRLAEGQLEHAVAWGTTLGEHVGQTITR